jgi:hypothetical protein
VAGDRGSPRSVVRLAGAPGRWIPAARELGWMAASRPPRVRSLSWPVDERALRGSVLRWPAAYGWEPARIWADPLLHGMSRHVRVERVDIPQPHDGIVRFEWGSVPAALDYSDYPHVDEACAAEVAVYFKMQHRRGGYGRDHVVPGGYVPSRPRLYRLLGHLRRERDRAAFAHDVYGRFSLAYAAETRRRAVEILEAQDRFGFGGGMRTVGYGESLREVARARVCLDLPGNGDLCHRLVEYLAVGACVVGPRPGVELHVPLVDGEHVAYAADDLSDLVEVCERYVRDAPARERMAAAARDHFDRYLHRDQLAAYYVHVLATRLEPGG